MTDAADRDNVVPLREAADGAVMAGEAEAFFARHMVLPPLGAVLLTVLVIVSRALHDAGFSHAPRLVVTAPVPDAGKTTLMELLTHLVARPAACSGLSPADLFRTIEEDQPTIIIDEANDNLPRRNAQRVLMRVLNSGHFRPLAWERRRVKDPETKEWVTRGFSTFAMVVLSGIGTGWITASLLSRSFLLPLEPKLAGEDIVDFHPDDHGAGAALLASQIDRWVEENIVTLRAARPSIPGNRAADNARPLLAVAETIGGDWPARVRAAIQRFTPAAANDDPRLLLAHIHEIVSDAAEPPKLHKVGADGPDDPGRIFTAELCSRLVARIDWPYERLTQHALAERLRAFGVLPRQSQEGGRKSRKQSAYWLIDFQAPFVRYGVIPSGRPVDPPPTKTSTGLPDESAGVPAPEPASATATRLPAEEKLHYQVTPPEMMAPLQDEFDFNFDAAPHPRPDGFDGLTAEWGTRTYCNPPYGGGLQWARKAVEEHRNGKLIVMVLPVYQARAFDILTAAGAELRSVGKPKWLALEDGSPHPGAESSRHPCMLFILRPRPRDSASGDHEAPIAEPEPREALGSSHRDPREGSLREPRGDAAVAEGELSRKEEATAEMFARMQAMRGKPPQPHGSRPPRSVRGVVSEQMQTARARIAKSTLLPKVAARPAHLPPAEPRDAPVAEDEPAEGLAEGQPSPSGGGADVEARAEGALTGEPGAEPRSAAVVEDEPGMVWVLRAVPPPHRANWQPPAPRYFTTERFAVAAKQSADKRRVWEIVQLPLRAMVPAFNIANYILRDGEYRKT
jgi:hypothetical protein